MGLLSGSVSVCRYEVAYKEAPDFEAAAFREIVPESELRESLGFVPFEPEAPYELGARAYAFRVRVDRRRPDPTRVKERLRQLLKTELETSGRPFVGPKKKRELRLLAEDELVAQEAPRSKIIECAMDGPALYIGSTSRNVVGMVLVLLSKIGVTTAPRNPWFRLGLPELLSDVVETRDASESIYGCQFLKELVGDAEFPLEPEAGRVKLATREAKISLAGEVQADLYRYLERGAEVVSAKLVWAGSGPVETGGELVFSFDAPGFRLSGLRLPPAQTGHWTTDLLERVARIGELYDRLDAKFEEAAKQGFGKRPSATEAAPAADEPAS